ncbi:MAG: hypothetical protein K2M07_03990 [Muribaculaceae bacterium]|nr:hypothetical protein [Muribaculaceae bacterium]
MNLKDSYNSKNTDFSPAKEDLWSRRFPENPDASELILAVMPEDFSASRIAGAVEDCNAHLINLNVTRLLTGRGQMIVDLRINHSDSSNVARSLERYGYEILDHGNTLGSGADMERARNRADEILRILNI